MRVSFLAICVLTCLIAPSFQYGTMFADNITPAFEDDSYFSGIRTFEGFSTDASFGLLGSTNVAGFQINTPRRIKSESSDLSIVTSQGIEFGGVGSNVVIDSAGSLSFSGQRVDIDTGSLDFEGDGSIGVGGLESTLRSSSFLLNTAEDISISSDGSILDINAPIAIDIFGQNLAQMTANNNIEISSQSGNIFASADSNLILNSNYLDIEAQISFAAQVDDSLSITAAAIVEFASVSKAQNTFNDMDVVVSSGDVVLSAAGVISFETQAADPATITMSGERNNFVVSRSAAESILQFQTDGAFRATATNQVTFANFDETSDITFTGLANTVMQAPDVSVTTSYGRITARNDLVAQSTGDMDILVDRQDLKIAAVTGNVEFLSENGDFDVTTEDNFVTSSREAYIDTKSSMTFTADDISLRQNDLNFDGGSLRLEIATDFDIDSSRTVEFDTSGDLDFTMGGDVIVESVDILIQASKGFDSVRFSTEDTVSIDGNSIVYESDILTLNGNEYIVDAEDLFSVRTTNDINIFIGDTTEIESLTSSISVSSVFGKSVIDAGDSVTYDVTSLTHTSFSFVFDAGDVININTDDIDFIGESSFTSEIEGTFSVNAGVDLAAKNTVQFVQDQFELESDFVSFFSGVALYMSQNLPTDELLFNQNNGGSFTATGDYISLLASGDLTIETDTFLAQGDESFTVEGFNSVVFDSGDLFQVDANSLINIASGGALTMETETASVSAQNDLIINGPFGENALVKFNAIDMEVSVDDGLTFLNNDITYNTGRFFMIAQNSIKYSGNEDSFGEFSLFSENRLSLITEEQLEVVGNLAGEFFAGNSLTMNGGFMSLFAAHSVELQAPFWNIASANDLEIIAGDEGRLVWEGETLSFQSDNELEIDANDNFSLYSGGDLVFNIQNSIVLQAPDVFLIGKESANFKGNSFKAEGDEVELLSQGSTTFNIFGSTTSASDSDHHFEAATFNIKAGPTTWTIRDDLDSNNYDGVTTYWADQSGLFNAGTGILVSAGGSTFVNGTKISYTTQGQCFLVGTGNIVFDSINNNVLMTATIQQSYATPEYGFFNASESISFDAASELSVDLETDFDFFAESDIQGDIGGSFVYDAASFGNFESENRMAYQGKENFEINAEGNILASTGEQGGILMESEVDYSASATTSQSWQSSDNFDVQVDNAAGFVSGTDFSFFTTGGPTNFDIDNDMITTYQEDLSYTSGDLIAFRTDALQEWTSQTSSITATADQGNIVISGSNEDSSFSSQNNMVIQANGQRNPTDGIRITVDDTVTFDSDVKITMNPLNNLEFGGLTHPKVNFIAAGSPTQIGYSMTSDGDINTFSADGTRYAATGQFTLDVGRTTEMFTSDTASISAGSTFTTTSAAGTIHLHGDSVMMSGGGPLTATATAGRVEILGENMGEISVAAEQGIQLNANLFRADVGPYRLLAPAVTHTIGKASSYSTTPGGGGSFDLRSANTLTVDSVGAISVQSLGYDGSVLVQSDNTFSIQTAIGGDISLLAAASMDMQYSSTLGFISNDGFTIEAASNRGEDHSRGDVGFFGSTFTGTSGDSFTFSANRDMLIKAEVNIDIDSTGDISFESTDDTIVRSEKYIVSTKDLFFENSIGNGGDISFIVEELYHNVLFTIGDDITWDVGQNVIGEVSRDFSQIGGETVFSTSGKDADLEFLSGGSMNFQNSGVTSFTTNTPVVGDGTLSILGAELVGIRAADLTFTSNSESIDLDSSFGAISIQSRGAMEFFGTGDNGRISLSADGSSQILPNAGIFVFSQFSTVLVGAEPTSSTCPTCSGIVTVDAYEAIELKANALLSLPGDLLSNIVNIGYVAPSDPSGVRLPTLSKTSLQATGPGADIFVNLRETQDGLGTLSILAGNNGNPLDSKTASSQADFFAIDTFSFESESGLNFRGSADIALALRPTDIFFTAQGPLAGIELSTAERATLADIDIETVAAVFDSNGKMEIRTDSETGGSTRFECIDGQINFSVQSPDEDDNIEISAYRGEMELTIINGDIIMVPERNLNYIGRKGVEFTSTNGQVLRADSSVTITSDGDIMEFYGTTSILAQGNSMDFTTTNGDIVVESESLEFTGDGLVFRSSGNLFLQFGSSFTLTGSLEIAAHEGFSIPMREGTITVTNSAVGAVAQCSTIGEVAIAHNNQYYIPGVEHADIKDTGIWICYCSQERSWKCRALSPTIPREQAPF